jgi:N-hydroxyarylamine O-acetyltransferase
MLDVQISVKIDIDPVAIQEKLVYATRGGYCFEHNVYALHLLKALGFHVTPILGRTIWKKNADIVGPATHIILKVLLDDELWLFDVGFSSFGTPTPLRINNSDIQTTPLESRKITTIDNINYIHSMFRNNEWHDIFIFTLQESHPYDWEIGSYFVSTHPMSYFRANILVSFITPTCRYLLLNKVLFTHYLDGSREDREISSEEEYVQVLKTIFHLILPEGTKICAPHTTLKF